MKHVSIQITLRQYHFIPVPKKDALFSVQFLK